MGHLFEHTPASSTRLELPRPRARIARTLHPGLRIQQLVGNAAAQAVFRCARGIGVGMGVSHPPYSASQNSPRLLTCQPLEVRQRTGVHLESSSTNDRWLARQAASEPSASSGTAKQSEKKEPEVRAGRPDWPWPIFDHLVLKLPERWTGAYHAMRSRSDYILFTKEQGYDLVYRQVMALMNLFQAGVFTGISPYKPDFSKGLDMAEGLSGVSDTWINLASIGLRLDLKKYLEEDVGDAALGNLAWAILYGVAIQGGLVGLNVATESDLDFTSLLGKALKKPTAAPRGLTRPYSLGNIPDERWGSYPFWAGPGGLSLKLGGLYDPAKPYTFSGNFGFNVAQVADLYPEDEAAKNKYNGFELFPYFSISHSWAKEREPPFDPNEPLAPTAGSLPPKVADQWLAGVFFGDRGWYTLLEGGPKLGPGNDLLEVYTRTGLFARDLGPISLLQGTGEWSYRPHDSVLRARLNAATQISLVDNRRWQLTLGGQLGYLFPRAGSPGAVDLGGGLSFYHKSWRAGITEPLKTGFEASAMWRPQDPFDPASSRLTSLKTGFSIFDFFKLAVEYHTITGGKLSETLPKEDVRFMIYPGKGMFLF
jgi:hypothetical protein